MNGAISCDATADPRTGIGQWVLLTMTGDPNGFGSLDPGLVAGISGFASQPIAPGEIVSLFGQLVGPDYPAGPQFDAGDRVSTSIAAAIVGPEESFLLLLPLLLGAGDLRQTSGRYQVTLRPPADGLVQRAGEEMQIEFRVQDTSRPDPLTGFAPVIRAAPDAVVDMPQMPGMPKFTETAHPKGVAGDYGIHPTFAHGGAYRLQLTIHPPAADQFTVDFPLEVLDASGKA